MGLVTVFWPLTRTGSGATVVQTAGGTSLVVNYNMKQVELAGPSLQGRQSVAEDSYGVASRKYRCEPVMELVYGLVAPWTLVNVPLTADADCKLNPASVQVRTS